jgi:hypothetical protein
VRGPAAARSEGLDLLGSVLEGVPQLGLLEDRLVALVEAAQVRGGARLGEWVPAVLPWPEATVEAGPRASLVAPFLPPSHPSLPPKVMGVLGCARKRQLLLWAAVDLSRAVDRSDTLALRIATRALEGPDGARRQVGGRSWAAALGRAAPRLSL